LIRPMTSSPCKVGMRRCHRMPGNRWCEPGGGSASSRRACPFLHMSRNDGYPCTTGRVASPGCDRAPPPLRASVALPILAVRRRTPLVSRQSSVPASQADRTGTPRNGPFLSRRDRV
jgi:hypothetical protein